MIRSPLENADWIGATRLKNGSQRGSAPDTEDFLNPDVGADGTKKTMHLGQTPIRS